MSDISKDMSFIKGLAVGMEIDTKSNEGKLIMKLIETACEMADRIEELEGRIDDLTEELEELDEEVYDLSMDLDDIYENTADDDSFGYDFDDDDDDGLFEDFDEDDDNLFEIMCPECGEDVVVDFDLLDDENSIVCPNCHRNIELKFDIPDDESDISEDDDEDIDD